MQTRVMAGGALLAISALVAGDVSAQDVERFSVAGSHVAVYNLAGTVRVEEGSGSQVVVEVRRAGRDAERLRIERLEVGGRNALVVRYPSGDVVYDAGGRNSQSTVNVRRDGTFYGRGGGGTDRITVRSSGRGTQAYADLRILVPRGRGLDVRLGVGEVTASGIEGDLDIEVGASPVRTSSTRGRLRIDTGSGRVQVSEAEGDVSIDTGSGSVEVNRVRGDRVRIDTGSGAVRGAGITARSLLVDTGSGRIELGGVSAPDVELDTGSGSVELELLSDVDRLRIDTGSGAVRLMVPASLGASFTADSGSGGVSVDAPFQARHRSRQRVTGTFGDGRGSIEIDTGSGAIRIGSR